MLKQILALQTAATLEVAAVISVACQSEQSFSVCFFSNPCSLHFKREWVKVKPSNHTKAIPQAGQQNYLGM